jgi:MoxR-like ATPase
MVVQSLGRTVEEFMTDITKPTTPSRVQTLADAVGVARTIEAWLKEFVKGRDDVIEYVLVALLGDGHILLEDYPGSGKTTLAKALGYAIQEDGADDTLPHFRRIQFTPDLLPSDVTGVMVFDTESNTFHFRRGPVFSYVLLIDEINRTSPKVQAALLEAMAEKQVTVDNTTHELDELFFVIATQNPLDLVGTYPLPVAQLDRFLFKVRMHHIDRESELEVIRRWGHQQETGQFPTVTRSDILAARRIIRDQTVVSELIHHCLVDVARALRADKRVLQGVSTRSLVQAVPALQTLAALRGRDYVTGDDISYLAPPIFQHRLDLVPGSSEASAVIRGCLREPLETLSRSTLKVS